MLDDLCVHLHRLRDRIDFEIIVTTPHTDTGIIKEKLNPLMVEVIDNKGRDILPFLKVLPHTLDFDYACKIHTKTIDKTRWQGPNKNNQYGTWRDDLWHSIMLPENAAIALDELSTKDINMYAPDNLWINHHSDHALWKKNIENMNTLGKFLNVDLPPKPFIAGSMFWFKPQALAWLTEFDLDELFEPEQGANDGKMEHTFERCLIQLAGMR
jgi:lipopolysaccharide biosynthesis protein